MKAVIIVFPTLLSLSFSLPIYTDRIVFPDEKKIKEIVNRFLKVEREPKNLENDSNLLKSENSTADYLIDKNADTKFEYGEYYQGDIILKEDQMDFINRLQVSDSEDGLGARTGFIWAGYRWPKNSKGNVIVPYVIDKNHFNTFDELKILYAMLDIEKFTCIQFIPRETERDYVHIHSGIGCNSHLGRQGGRQLVSLQRKGCMSRGTILHELIHALGYDHMQNHNDRDDYVYILWNNIYETQKNNFQKVSPFLFSNFGTQYDYYSVMHYEPYAFSKNGLPTVLPKDSSFNKIIGQRNALSSGDAERINNMYKCS